MKPLIVIAGPTACKKTASSVAVAKKICGEIISADSMQVYKYMDIGTAKIKEEEKECIPHYLIDEFMPDEEFNVKIFQQKAVEYINKIYSNGNVPIIVGGTGFYINSLVYNNNFMETNLDIRHNIELEYKKYGTGYLYNKLKEIDIEYAQNIHPNNVKKIIRAIEFFYQNGIKLSQHNKEQHKNRTPYDLYFFVLNMDRQKLYERINKRVDIMIENGLVEEVKKLMDMGYSSKLVSMQGIGYKELIDYINGLTTLDEAIELIKKGTRHFAKRQLTWFKNQCDAFWIDVTEKDDYDIAEQMINYITNRRIK